MTFPPGTRLPSLRPRHDGDMQWFDQLAAVFRDNAIHEVHDGPPLLYIQTWYIHHENHPRCEQPRPIRLDNSMITWLEEFRFAWRDLLDHRRSFSIYIVRPRPPQPRHHDYACHVLIEQAKPRHRVAGVVTNLFEGDLRDALQQFATILPHIVRAPDVIDELHLNLFCDFRRCTITVGDLQLHLVAAHDLYSGFGMCIRIAPPDHQLPVRPGFDGEHFADVSMLQVGVSLPSTSSTAAVEHPALPARPHTAVVGRVGNTGGGGRGCFQLRADAPDFIPGARHLEGADEFTQDLHAIWVASARQWEDETPSIEILVWFADHSALMPHGLVPRRLRLWPQFAEWEPSIRQLWSDLIQANAPIEYNIVTPAPPRLETGIAAHVIVIQHAREDWVTSLVTLTDQTGLGAQDQFFRRAVTTTEHIYLEHLITTMGYADQCLLRPSQFLCRAWYHDLPLRIGRPIPGRSGYSIVLHVQRTPVWRGCAIEPAQDTDRSLRLADLLPPPGLTHQTLRFACILDHLLTQLDALPGFDLHGPDPVESPGGAVRPHIPILMTEVRTQLDIFDQFFFVPNFHLEQWSDATHWLDQWWDCETPITDVWIYHDGSRKDSGTGGAAVAFVYQPASGWIFGGAVSASFGNTVSSYGAELRGGALAVQLGIDILKLTTLIQADPPNVCLLHDNTAVGNQLVGRWNANADFRIAGLVRHLLVYAEHRFGKKWSSHYIAAHRGGVGNEIADSLASDAAEGKPLADLQHWQDTLFAPHFCSMAAWFWTFYSQHFQQWWTGADLCLPLQAETQVTTQILPDRPTTLPVSTSAEFDCTFGSCNVLTLKATPTKVDVEHGMSGPTRQQIIFQQFLDARVCIFALQETRLRQGSKNMLGYMVFRGNATDQGHHGTLIAISTTIPYGTTIDERGRPQALYFVADDVSIITVSARYVLLRLRTPWLHCVLVAGHAPHSGNAIETIEQWWASLGDAIPPALRDWPIVLMADANAKVGADQCHCIGPVGAEAGNEKTEAFTSFVRSHCLWLPSTFDCHVGPSGTWKHPSGSWTRNDYIGLPTAWTATSCHSWIPEDIDVSLHHEDHCAVLVRLKMHLSRTTTCHYGPILRCPAESADLSTLRNCTPVGPGLDVHSHALWVQDQIVQCIPRAQRKGPIPLKATMSSDTWNAVLAKRQWRSALREANDLQKSTLLQLCFASWRQAVDVESDGHEVSLFAQGAQILASQDRFIARALHEFRNLGRLVTRLSRADDIKFFHDVLAEGAHYLAPHQTRDLWKSIKRALPKYRQRRLAADPLKLLALEENWNPHFEALEAGCVVAPEQLVEEATCTHVQERTHLPPSVEDLPTLFDLEHTLRANKVGRATGYDPITSAMYHHHAAELAEHAFPLMVKMWVWGEEPLQYKGGPMALIPKRPHPSAVHHFRGILLLPTLAKSFHALLRKRIIGLLTPQRLPGQFGGFAGQEVLFGSQALRIAGRTALAKGLSFGVLFVDLATAFHCLVREMVVGIGDADKLHFVMEALHWSDDARQRLQLGHALPCLLESLGAPAYLVRLMRNVHDSTWTTINGKEYLRTHRGTRPGSPIADAVFHFIMYDFSMALKQYLQDSGSAALFEEHLAMDLDMIIWSDDLAVPLLAERASMLVPKLLHLLDFVKAEFCKRGFQLNLAKGKTGVVATFCGPDAATLRRQYQLIPQPGMWHTFEDGSESFVHMTPAYRHLGTLFTSDQQLDTEIAFRIGVSRAAFDQIRKRILANRHLPIRLRLQLFNSLVLSKLYFAAGSWHTPTGRQIDRLRTAISRMIKIIYGNALPTRATAQLFSHAGILDPRAKLATERLLYAQRLFHHGPAFLQLMIHAEAEHHPFSWLVGLRHDLQWMQGVEADPDPMLVAHDMTDLIDHWQRDTGRWKHRIHRVGRRHLYQEAMILEVQQWHADIFKLLRSQAFTFCPDPAQLHLQERLYPCPDCDRCFTTPQGVHTHRRKKHGVFSLEHHLLDSATCPACLTYLWSTQRVQQHLAYMPRSGLPNPCFAYLQQIGYAVSYAVEHLPTAQKGQSRLDALPTAGPYGCGPTARDRHLADLRARKLAVEAEFFAYVQPHDSERAGDRLGSLLSATTRNWFRDFCDANHNFAPIERPQDRWLDILCRLPSDYESWTARVFILWGRHILPDIIAELWDGEAEAYLDAEYAELAAEFDEYWLEARLQSLTRQIDQAAEPIFVAEPHRPVRPPQQDAQPRSTPQLAIPRLFQTQERWHAELERVQWLDLPADPCTPLVHGLRPRPTFIVVHLFAGRRRETDLHAWLDHWAHRHNFDVMVLSMDTAISPVLGNLDANGESWAQLSELYLRGYVAATISGHPCETFSSARWTEPPPELQHHRWPRPLRTALRLFGLDHRSFRELRQTRLGSAFFLQTVWALACHVVYGGLFLEEHPGIPTQPHHPSVWRSAILQLFRKHPDIRLHEIAQWRFGASTVKPTGLLALRMPHFLADLYAHADPGARRPVQQAIGLDQDGNFRTSCHKEYPHRLSSGFASAIANQLLRNFNAQSLRPLADLPHPLRDWVHEVARDSDSIRSNTTWLPDFQGWCFWHHQLDFPAACLGRKERTFARLWKWKWKRWLQWWVILYI